MYVVFRQREGRTFYLIRTADDRVSEIVGDVPDVCKFLKFQGVYSVVKIEQGFIPVLAVTDGEYHKGTVQVPRAYFLCPRITWDFEEKYESEIYVPTLATWDQIPPAIRQVVREAFPGEALRLSENGRSC